MCRRYHSAVLITCGLYCSAAVAVSPQSLPDSIRRCALMVESASRLACYDKLAAATTGSDTPALLNSSPAPTGEQEFGLEADSVRQLRARAGLTQAPKPSQLTARIAVITELPYGRKEFTLDNGQVWRQTESQTTPVMKVGDALTITPGMLGSFWMQTDSRFALRAKRIR
jgi:hypothetical protein